MPTAEKYEAYLSIHHHLVNSGLVLGATTCYPHPSCDPGACHIEAQENTLSADALKDKTSKAQVIVKKDDDARA